MTSTIKRRTLVKGAAWAAPAVAVTATIPAYAASPAKEIYEDVCAGTESGYGDYWTNTVYWSSSRWINLTGLPKGVKVSKITVQAFFPTRTTSGGHLDGFTSWLDTTVKSNSPAKYNNGTITWQPKTSCSGWMNTATTTNPAPHTFQNGYQHDAFSVTFTWDANLASCNNYTPQADGTNNFNTFDSGPMKLVFNKNFYGANYDSPTFGAQDGVYTWTFTDESGRVLGTMSKTLGTTNINDGHGYTSYPQLTVANIPDNPLAGYVAKTHEGIPGCTYLNQFPQFK